jgi:hypothetical protein
MGSPSAELADDAVSAFAHAARALQRMRDDGLDGIRSLAVGELAGACAAASAAWRGLPNGRLTDLMGAAADVASRDRWVRSERWVICVAIADSVRRLADLALGHEPYTTAPPIARVRNTGVTVARLAAQQPPSPEVLAVLDAAIPVATLPRGLRGSRVAAESAIALDAELRGLHHPRLFEGLCVLRVAETAAAYCAAGASAAVGDGVAWRQAASRWRYARSLLRSFGDGTRGRPEPTNVLLWAVRLDQGLRAEFGPAADLDPEALRARDDLDVVAQQLGVVATRLSAIATHLEAAGRQWGSGRALVVRANEVQFREGRLEEVLQRRMVMADTGDLLPVMTAIRKAGLQSVQLAAELNRGAAARVHISAGHMAYSAVAARGAGLRTNCRVAR